ncbi:MAG: hypothetical protein HY606_08600, partial [Planctomycetes bacterium]|nr:hypothetical protein [Planctomycetota bacterium]
MTTGEISTDNPLFYSFIEADYASVLTALHRSQITDTLETQDLQLLNLAARTYINIGAFNKAREIIDATILNCRNNQKMKDLAVSFVLKALLELEMNNDQWVKPYLDRAEGNKPSFNLYERVLFEYTLIVYLLKAGNPIICLNQINETLKEVKNIEAITLFKTLKTEFLNWLEFYKLYVLIQMQEGRNFQEAEVLLTTFTNKVTNPDHKWKILFDLAELNYQNGNLNRAQEHTTAAIKVAEGILAGLPDPLKDLFIKHYRIKKLHHLHQIITIFSESKADSSHIEVINKLNATHEIIKKIKTEADIHATLTFLLDTALYYCKALRSILVVYDKGKQIININRCRLGSSIKEEDHSVIDQVIKTTLVNNDEICNLGEMRSGLSKSILSRFKRGTFISIPIRAGSTNLGALY